MLWIFPNSYKRMYIGQTSKDQRNDRNGRFWILECQLTNRLGQMDYNFFPWFRLQLIIANRFV